MTNRPAPQIETIHGFRVLTISPITKAFERALKLLASLWFVDPWCVIVKTPWGRQSGITHAGGRYIHPSIPYAQTVISKMKDQGIEPPPMPFILAPGATTLFHEWGHHVDLCWSRDDHTIIFSTKWFSHFYEIRQCDAPPKVRERNHGSNDPEPEGDAPIVIWHRFASELFADLFDEWMRGDKNPNLDCCHAGIRTRFPELDTRFIRIDVLKDRGFSEIREKTYALFTKGLKGPEVVPDLRSDFFGRGTEMTVHRFRVARIEVRHEMS